mgnify:CR=1 FL=1
MTECGGGWAAHVDPATGATYYARGNDVRWERPTEASQAPKWQSRVDPSTGATYYYNESTRETSWTPPEPKEEAAGEWLHGATKKENAGRRWAAGGLKAAVKQGGMASLVAAAKASNA